LPLVSGGAFRQMTSTSTPFGPRSKVMRVAILTGSLNMKSLAKRKTWHLSSNKYRNDLFCITISAWGTLGVSPQR
jgi:hypothetical protein